VNVVLDQPVSWAKTWRSPQLIALEDRERPHHGTYYIHSDFQLMDAVEAMDVSASRQVQASLNFAVAQSTAPLLQMVGQLANRVSVIERRLAGPTRLPIYEFPGYALRSPLSVELEETQAGWIATLPELDLWADGQSASQAIEELKASLGSLTTDLLGADDGSLGSRPRRWRALLSRLTTKA
jgi:hypothetical protein